MKGGLTTLIDSCYDFVWGHTVEELAAGILGCSECQDFNIYFVPKHVDQTLPYLPVASTALQCEGRNSHPPLPTVTWNLPVHNRSPGELHLASKGSVVDSQ